MQQLAVLWYVIFNPEVANSFTNRGHLMYVTTTADPFFETLRLIICIFKHFTMEKCRKQVVLLSKQTNSYAQLS
jgi:hypothetical protein